MKKVSLLILLFSAIGALLPAQAAKVKLPDVFAEVREYTSEYIRAVGQVEVVWEEYRIYADEIDYNIKTSDLKAVGRVTIATPDMTISGDRLEFNTQTRSGVLYDAVGLVSPFLNYKSSKIRQTDNETLDFERLNLTSCVQVVPRWRISGGRGKIKKEKYVALSNAVFHIKNIPVFYIPYLRYPIQKDGRATGFLIPNVGSSSLRGFFLQNAFFWNISRNLDLTLNHEYYGKLGQGLGQELRYLFPKASGTLRFLLFRYRKDPDNPQADRRRDDYHLEARHVQSLPFLNSRLVVDIDRPSNPDFLRYFDNDFERVLSTRFNSSAYWTASFAGFNLSVAASSFETYYIFSNTSNTLQYLPNVSLNMKQQKLGGFPGHFSFQAGYQSLRRTGISYEEEPVFLRDVNSRRFTFVPRYNLSVVPASWLSLGLTLESNHKIYNQQIDPESGEIIDQPLHAGFQTAEITLQGPTFFRIYEGRKNRYKHVIEPQFVFRWAGKLMNRDNMLQVDYLDYPSFSYAGFTLATRLFSRARAGAGNAREIMSLALNQRYYLDPAEANYFRKVDGVYPAFSELGGNLRFRPASFFSLDASASFNHQKGNLSRLNLGLTVEGEESPLSASVSFSRYNNPYVREDFIFNRSVIRGHLGMDLPGFPIKFDLGADYDFRDREFRYAVIGASFDYQCLVFYAQFRVYTFSQRPESHFQIGFSLGNLGAAGEYFK